MADDWVNRLYFGDNLQVLREHIPDESVDLVYLDPPFNSNATYNVLFKETSGQASSAQITAFEDTWHWGAEAEATYRSVVRAGGKTGDMLAALLSFLGRNDMMAYLTMMAPRLQELHRVLKRTGSLYLHCDPTASHYLKLTLDAIFGAENFRNEISWVRSNPKSLAKVNFPNCRDVILRYSKSLQCFFAPVFGEHDPKYVNSAYKYTDGQGRYRLLPLLNPNDDRPNLTYEFLGVTRVWRWTKNRMQAAYEEGRVIQLKPGAVPQYKLYLHESKGRTITDNWADIPQAAGRETLGYPTQKPEALLDRIIRASSNEGDLVLDAFCGCGTTIAVAERLHRRWIGIDITHLAITLLRHRLHDAFKEELHPFLVHGQPTDLQGARALAEADRHKFEWWALGMVDARPAQDRKKGADSGVDGRMVFFDDKSLTPRTIVLQVKSGHVGATHIRDLKGVLEREKAAIGVYITLEEPTKPMRKEAVAAGFYEPKDFPQQRVPKIQILTIEEILAGKKVDYPRVAPGGTFQVAERKSKYESKKPGRLL